MRRSALRRRGVAYRRELVNDMPTDTRVTLDIETAPHSVPHYQVRIRSVNGGGGTTSWGSDLNFLLQEALAECRRRGWVVVDDEHLQSR